MSNVLSADVDKVFSNDYSFVAVKSDGSAYTWGPQSYQGRDTGADSTTVSSALASGVERVYSSRASFAALKNDGRCVQAASARTQNPKLTFPTHSLVVWGDTLSGNAQGVATELAGNVKSVVSTGFAFAAVKEGGKVVVWGTHLRMLADILFAPDFIHHP